MYRILHELGSDYMNSPQEISAIIKQLVSEKPFSMSKMLADIGLGRNTISHLDNGSMLKADSLAKIAEYLGTSTDYLLGTSPTVQAYDENDNPVVIDDETRDIIDSLRTNPEMKMLFSVTRKATKEDIVKAVKIIEALKDSSEE